MRSASRIVLRETGHRGERRAASAKRRAGLQDWPLRISGLSCRATCSAVLRLNAQVKGLKRLHRYRIIATDTSHQRVDGPADTAKT